LNYFVTHPRIYVSSESFRLELFFLRNLYKILLRLNLSELVSEDHVQQLTQEHPSPSRSRSGKFAVLRALCHKIPFTTANIVKPKVGEGKTC